MINRFSDALCGCCGRTATGFGYAPKSGQTILWVCDDIDCLQLAKDSYTMKQDQFTRLESLAAGRGGEEGGAYLDSIDMGDQPMSAMTPDQFYEFSRRVVAGYRRGLAELIKTEAPF